ncbi:MAG: 50S ribosomal protein L20 [Rickettsiales bacterium]|nr:50S ribosomal protein L20 [Rickettsiales bacterium]
MAHVKRGVPGRKRHKKVMKMAKGYRGRSKNCYRVAVQKVEKALQYAYRDRRVKKRDFRRLWIQRINAAARQNGMTYATFMNGLNKAGIELDRKVLAELAVHEADAFTALVDAAREALGNDSAAQQKAA